MIGKVSLPLALSALLVFTPVLADDPVGYDLAISRLRACVTSGAAGAPRESLAAAVVAVRSLCHPQINTAYTASDREVARRNPEARGDRLAELRKQGRRQIDYDLARMVASVTGAQP